MEMVRSADDVTRRVFDTLTRIEPNGAPALRLWDGSTIGSGAASTIVLNHPGGLRAMMMPPTDLAAGEAYVYGDIDIEGDVFSLLAWAASLSEQRRQRWVVARMLRHLRQLPVEHRRTDANRPRLSGRLHSPRRDRDAVGYHYNTGNDFYELFLGQTMAYSSAYFLNRSESLDTAQRRKLDLICRKLELAPGTRFLDIGCGWGSLAIHAAVEYGAVATGVTISAEQTQYARQWAKRLGVDDRVEIIEGDYRDVVGEFEAIASVGMLEHVGRGRLGEYYAKVRSLLAPGGLFLNHGITTFTRERNRMSRPSFVSTYVFPDGELEPVDFVIGKAEEVGFETRDVESLRESYGQTLRRWVSNLEMNRDAAVAATSEETYRIWRIYMAGSAVGFERATIAVYQMLLADRVRPWRFGRRHLLADDDS